jgi:hypothetical protein
MCLRSTVLMSYGRTVSSSRCTEVYEYGGRYQLPERWQKNYQKFEYTDSYISRLLRLEKVSKQRFPMYSSPNFLIFATKSMYSTFSKLKLPLCLMLSYEGGMEVKLQAFCIWALHLGEKQASQTVRFIPSTNRIGARTQNFGLDVMAKRFAQTLATVDLL